MPAGRSKYTRLKTISDLVWKASPQPIVEALQDLSPQLDARKTWLGPGHPYRGNLTRLLDTPGYTPKIGSLLQYVACSTLLHAFDGWNYISRAFDSIGMGDRRTALHLAYYAELRAAMALLATQGIGVFNLTHVSFATKKEAFYVKATTHNFAWQAFGEWANQTRGLRGFLHNIHVAGTSLYDWLDKAGASPVVQNELSARWLNAWSIDLGLYEEDRNLRNEVSYRPSSIRQPADPPIHPTEESIEPLLRSWEAFEPSKMGSADVLDKHLLREALSFAYRIQSLGRPPSGPRFAAYLGRLSPDASEILQQFLRRETDPQRHFLLNKSADRTKTPTSALPTIARALLLLRVASAATARVFSDAGISTDDISFWWSQRIVDLGLSEDPAHGYDLTELWPEVGASIDAIETWRSEAPDPSSRDACIALGAQVPISQFQRTALWLLGNA